jgi:hypothetical protein
VCYVHFRWAETTDPVKREEDPQAMNRKPSKIHDTLWLAILWITSIINLLTFRYTAVQMNWELPTGLIESENKKEMSSHYVQLNTVETSGI